MSRTLILFGLFMLSIAFVASSPLALDATMILRQHYGVVFKPRQTVRPTTGHWLHSFGFTLPHLPTIARMTDLDCAKIRPDNQSHCIHVKPFVVALDNIQQNMSKMLLDVLRDIDSIIPSRPPPQRRERISRSWLPIIGQALKTITGTATEEHVNRAIAAVDELRKSQAI